jgi:hypothetical protein
MGQEAESEAGRAHAGDEEHGKGEEEEEYHQDGLVHHDLRKVAAAPCGMPSYG